MRRTVGAVLHFGYVPRPASRARTIASARLATSILLKIEDTWLRTVLGLSTSFSAMALLVSPWAMSCSTSSSRRVKSGKGV